MNVMMQGVAVMERDGTPSPSLFRGRVPVTRSSVEYMAGPGPRAGGAVVGESHPRRGGNGTGVLATDFAHGAGREARLRGPHPERRAPPRLPAGLPGCDATSSPGAPRRGPGAVLTALRLLPALVLAACVLVGGPAAAEVLVRNTDKLATSAQLTVETAQPLAQGFMTGPDRYTLTSVDFAFVGTGTLTGTDLTASIWTADTGTPPSPHSKLVDLTNPMSISRCSNDTCLFNTSISYSAYSGTPTVFLVASSTTLAADTRYFVVLTYAGAGDQYLYSVGDNAETSSRGWTIDDDSLEGNATPATSWTTESNSLLFRINGEVRLPNDAPTASDGMVGTNEDTDYTFEATDFSFFDTDATDTLASVKITGLPLPTSGTLSVDGTTIVAGDLPMEVTRADIDAGKLKYTPPLNNSGLVRFSFKVSDGKDDSMSAYVMTVTITAVNDPPTVANPIPDQMATVGRPFSYPFPLDTFGDVDAGDTLTYTATTAADAALSTTWLSFDATSRTFSGTPTAAGTLSVKVTATDGESASVSDTFDIVVSAPPAHCNATDPLELWCATMTVGTGTGVGTSFFGYFVPIMGTGFGSVAPSLRFSYRTAMIDVTTLNYDTTVGSLLRFVVGYAGGTTPDDGLLGASSFSLEIGTGGTKKSFAIDNPGTGSRFEFADHGLSWAVGDTVPVKLLRSPPRVANKIPNQTATADNEFSYTFPANTFFGAGDTPVYTATKADDSALSATWLSFDAGTRTFSGTPMSADVGTLSVKVTATDSTDLSVSDTFDIVVNAELADQTASVAEAFRYTVPANIFGGSSTTGTLTYTARLANGRALASNAQLAHGRVKPGWLRFNGSTRTFSGTPLPGSDGTLSVRVSAYDGAGARFSATFDITVVVDSGLVGNFTRPGTSGRRLEWFDHAQKFTTGADTAGYTVTSIDVLLRDVHSNSNFPTIEIRSGATLPGSNVGTLVTPTSGASGGDKPYRYTAPANLALSANSYWIVMTGGPASTARTTGWTLIDPGSAPGWSIESGTWRSNIQGGAPVRTRAPRRSGSTA